MLFRVLFFVCFSLRVCLLSSIAFVDLLFFRGFLDGSTSQIYQKLTQFWFLRASSLLLFVAGKVRLVLLRERRFGFVVN